MRINSRILFLIPFLIAVSSAFSQNSGRNFEKAKEKYNAIKDIESENKDSLINEYNTIITLVNFSSENDDELKLIIDVSDKLAALDENTLALSYLTALNERETLRFETRKDLYSILGYTFKNMGAYSLSSEYLKKSIENETKSDNGYVYSSIGINFLDLNQFDSASHYFKLQYRDAIKFSGYRAASNALNNAGWSFLKEKQLDSAMIYFNKSINVTIANKLLNPNDSTTLYNIYGNIGLTFQEMQHWDSSIYYLEKDYSYSSSKRSLPYLFGVSKSLVSSYIKLKKYKQAKQLIEIYKNLEYQLSITQKKELIILKLNYNSEKGIGSYNLIQQLIELNNEETKTLLETEKKNNNYIAEFLLNESKFKSKLQDAALEKKDFELTIANQNKSRLTSAILFIGFSLVLSIAILILYRRQSKLKTELLSESKNKLEYDLKLKNQDVTNLAISISQKQEYNKDVLKKLLKIKNSESGEIKNNLNTLILDLKSVNLVDKSRENFNKNLDVINAAFFEAIKEKHPNLSKKEKELCSLIRLGLSNKEIATVKNTAINSVKVAKYRLKNKLNLEQTGKNILDYLSKF